MTKELNKWVKVASSLVLLALIGCSDDASVASPVAPQEEAAGFAILGGGKADILAEERIVFLNYWAVWCGPCIAEMPELAEFSHTFADRAVIYAINYDQPSEEQLQSDVDILGVEVPALIYDPQEELGYSRPEVLPTTFVMKKGQLMETLVGPQNLASMEALLVKWEAAP